MLSHMVGSEGGENCSDSDVKIALGTNNTATEFEQRDRIDIYIYINI